MMHVAKMSSLAALLLMLLVVAACDTSSGASQGAVTSQSASAIPEDPRAAKVEWPVLSASTLADPQDVLAIKESLARARKIELVTSQTFDVTSFDTVYTNDPRIPLASEQLTFLNKLRQAQTGVLDAELRDDGFLSYMKSFYLNWKIGAEAIDRLQAQAQAQGRSVTGAEMHSVTGIAQGPWARKPANPNIEQVEIKPESFQVKDIKISGDQADVTYDDGMALRRSFLIRTKEGWKQAGMVTLNMHG